MTHNLLTIKAILDNIPSGPHRDARIKEIDVQRRADFARAYNELCLHHKFIVTAVGDMLIVVDARGGAYDMPEKDEAQ